MIIRNVGEKDPGASAECAVQSFGGEITADAPCLKGLEIINDNPDLYKAFPQKTPFCGGF